MARYYNSAFTLVEMLIVIAVVAVLSSLAAVSYIGVRQDSRDTARRGNVTVISEALEKYYERNGEYPSVASLVNDNPDNTGEVVAAKLSIEPSSLAMPEMPATTTNPLSAGPDIHNDYIVYEGQSAADNERCQSDINGGCDAFSLKYHEEVDGTITIESRRSSRLGVEAPDIVVSTTGPTSINVSWTSISGATSYTLQRSTSSDMSSPVSEAQTATSVNITGLLPSTEYFFRVRAIVAGASGEWSVIQSGSTSDIAAPTGTLNISASMSGSNAIGTASGGSCAHGTIERQIRYAGSSTASTGTWSPYISGNTRSTAAEQGWRYTFQQRSRCVTASGSSGWVTSGTATVVRQITSAPSAPSVTVTHTLTNSTWRWAAPACPTGAAAQHRSNRSLDNGQPATGWSGAISSGASPSYVWTDSRQGFQFTNQIQVRCYTVHSTGPWSGTGSNSFVRSVVAPGGATNFQWRSVDSYWMEIAWSGPSCGPGTTLWAYWFAYNAAGNWFGGYPAKGTSSNWTRFSKSTDKTKPYSVEISYRCINMTTDRQSATGPLTSSPTYYMP